MILQVLLNIQLLLFFFFTYFFIYDLFEGTDAKEE